MLPLSLSYQLFVQGKRGWIWVGQCLGYRC